MQRLLSHAYQVHTNACKQITAETTQDWYATSEQNTYFVFTIDFKNVIALQIVASNPMVWL